MDGLSKAWVSLALLRFLTGVFLTSFKHALAQDLREVIQGAVE
jgi:hypothetical protein